MISVARRVRALRDMDTAIRLLSDEENGIFEGWISLCVPDEATDGEIEEYINSDPEFYVTCSEYFARNISKLIVEGDWNDSGFSTEFYKSSYDKRLRGK